MRRSYHVVISAGGRWANTESFDRYESALAYAREESKQHHTRITHMGLTLWECDRSEVK